MFDRGSFVTEYLWLLYKLEDEAKEKKGYVHVILDNHDIMNLSGDLRYVQSKYFEEAKERREEYRNWYSINTELGRWLRTKNIIEKIGDNLYMHAGISSQVNSLQLSISEINSASRPWYDHPPTDSTVSILFDGKTSPFWYRGYFLEPKATTDQVDSTLTLYQCKRIIVGHTIIDSNVAIYYNGKVIGIDVDQHARKHEGLLIKHDRYYKVDDKRRRTLLGKRAG